ncbi:MAG: hypothetical protein KKE20_00580 [Nanoarchaeota archaeon]|nr:hypothetical protein [Nanoarchaeota archaeon]
MADQNIIDLLKKVEGAETQPEKLPELGSRSCSHWLDAVDYNQIKSLESKLRGGHFSLRPDSGLLNHHGEGDSTFDYDLSWSALRKEWVAESRGPELDYYECSIAHYVQGSYKGPFALDERAKKELLLIYGMTEKDVPLDKIAHTSPEDLLEIRFQNHLSHKVEPVIELMKIKYQWKYNYDDKTDKFRFEDSGVCIMIPCGNMRELVIQTLKYNTGVLDMTTDIGDRIEESSGMGGSPDSKVKHYHGRAIIKMNLEDGQPKINYELPEHNNHEWSRY